MEKAKYIQDKEATLFNDLNKANRKMKEIANWYDTSDYTQNSVDEKNVLLFIKDVNNLYHNLDSLLQATKNFKLHKNLNALITSESLDLEGIVKYIVEANECK